MLTNKSNIPKRVVALLLGDLIVICFAPWFVLGSTIFNRLGYSFAITDYRYGWFISLSAIIIFIVCFHLFGLYDFRQNFITKKNCAKIFGAIFTSSVTLVFISYIFRLQFNSRWAYFYFSCCVLVGIFLVRFLYSVIGSPNQYSKKIVIFGYNSMGKEIAEEINKQEKGWMTLCSFINHEPDEDKSHPPHQLLDSPSPFLEKGLGGEVNYQDKENRNTIDLIPVLELKESLSKTLEALKPDVLILAVEKDQVSNYMPDIIKCGQAGIQIWDMATAYEIIDAKIPLDYIDDQWLLFAVLNGPNYNTWRFKRLCDIIGAGLGFLITIPFMLLSFVAVFIESGRPVIIVQERIGRNGKIFNMYKIRTMTNTEPEPGETGSNSITKRVTRVGKVLRRCHFDEFPQFINILKGELSLIGPRSELFDFVYQYINQDNLCLNPDNLTLKSDKLTFHGKDKKNTSTDTIEEAFCNYIPYIEQRFTVPQGITGWAQVHAPKVSSSYDDMITKLEYDLYYIKNLSLLLDFEIFLRTIKIMLFGNGK